MADIKSNNPHLTGGEVWILYGGGIHETINETTMCKTSVTKSYMDAMGHEEILDTPNRSPSSLPSVPQLRQNSSPPRFALACDSKLGW